MHHQTTVTGWTQPVPEIATFIVPAGVEFRPVREPPLKDEFDEWLARVICFALAIPPSALIREMNRATAETAQQAALAEGLGPLMAWVKGLLDRIIRRHLGWDDVEFAWVDALAPDLDKQARIHAAYVSAGIKTRNEIRAELGLPPRPGGDALAKAGFNSDEPRD